MLKFRFMVAASAKPESKVCAQPAGAEGSGRLAACSQHTGFARSVMPFVGASLRWVLVRRWTVQGGRRKGGAAPDFADSSPVMG